MVVEELIPQEVPLFLATTVCGDTAGIHDDDGSDYQMVFFQDRGSDGGDQVEGLALTAKAFGNSHEEMVPSEDGTEKGQFKSVKPKESAQNGD